MRVRDTWPFASTSRPKLKIRPTLAAGHSHTRFELNTPASTQPTLATPLTRPPLERAPSLEPTCSPIKQICCLFC